jgi:hypothetical protein
MSDLDPVAMRRPWWRPRYSWRPEDVIYRWVGRYDLNPRGSGMPHPPADGLSMRFGDHGDGLDPPGPMLVARVEDGHALWLGYWTAWRLHFSATDARRLAWWILVRWWMVGEWFGLRRVLWYWALSRRVNRTRRRQR